MPALATRVVVEHAAGRMAGRDRLGDEASATLDEARRHAADALSEGLRVQRNPRLRARAGLPEPQVARRLYEGLREQLWARA